MRDTGKSGGKPGAAGKGRKKREKGAARKFVTSLEEMTLRDEQEEQKRKVRGDDEEGSDSEDESDSDEDGEELVAFERVQTNSLFGFSNKADGPALQQEKKKVGFAAIAKTQNPNSKKKANKVMKAKDMDENAAPQQLSRREREAIEKERSAAYYLKKHLAGETDEAKKDLARLAEVKRRREEADQRKKEEEAAAAEREKAKKKVQVKDDDEPLDARAIKALKPALLKEKLKERDLSTQGQKKDLIQRLIDYENERAI
ncbi:uncharacterized protein PITG_09721 [Phytophthora infestans T30-4]|uniref:SAP domain-containing protein n=2 Tax=Phytophthora infestans TaxID=4787 RepID=D0NCN2_PHYIT|nr:uncharacterized protein PITG_09721 [Phytophthora infestans T30-4]KAF4044479.1 SAP domain-containing protein [Phytophthora infestans]EEY55746.1 conserved hypothetical protein [Phytophthora infestans T30-4]KAF4136158.1 SAP domain-containing protein [Phytophthora infestans]KAF4149471.1 SAP domain-containing protein [Phytophthora infestans]KAI9984521.1 hypothetical protein PInf_005879 [Phytophthora infestans]|eukprot:XP_002903322.1 conserved hypothetical protein [Phytophthora infestans T30-4]